MSRTPLVGAPLLAAALLMPGCAAKGVDTGVVERYARALEGEIRRSPADWLWVHRKWKYGRPRAAAAPSPGGEAGVARNGH